MKVLGDEGCYYRMISIVVNSISFNDGRGDETTWLLDET